MTTTIHHGDCLDILPTIPPNSVSAIVTDPPAGISFMGRDWDGDKGGRDQWIAWMQLIAAECLRTIKPGGHALVWALPRTSHWTATAWENAGWEIREIVHHHFGTGFPKSLDVSKAIDKMAGAEREVIGLNPNHHPVAGNHSRITWGDNDGGVLTAPATDAAKQWAGWHSALKPSTEHWVLMRAPLSEKNIASNVLKHSTGAINVDACRVPANNRPHRTKLVGMSDVDGQTVFGQGLAPPSKATGATSLGRWPSNLILTADPCVLNLFPQTSTHAKTKVNYEREAGSTWSLPTDSGQTYPSEHGSAARFFNQFPRDDEPLLKYAPKASKRDRAGSRHPTVKGQKLLEWLCTLITPPGGTILDPFAGSGSLATAANKLGFNTILIEREAEYYEDCLRRVAAFDQTEDELFSFG